jgi:hypothetical protein
MNRFGSRLIRTPSIVHLSVVEWMGNRLVQVPVTVAGASMAGLRSAFAMPLMAHVLPPSDTTGRSRD